MSTIQELYGNLEQHKLKLKRYKRNGDNKRKKYLTLKASNSFENDEDELDNLESKDDEDEMALLSKKLQRILKENKNKEKRKIVPQKKVQNKHEQG